MDQIDERLMELLSEDARQSSTRLAMQLSISAATAKRRLRRLLQSGVLHIVAVPDPYQIGLLVTAMIGLKVDHNKIEGVLRTLDRKPQCRWVSATTGRFDILFIAGFHSNHDLADFIQKELSKIDGIRDIETFICFDVQTSIYTRCAITEIDQVDERLIELLSEDARQSCKELAMQLAISTDTARHRLRKLLQSGVLHIVALPDPCETGLPVSAVIALKVDPDRIERILRTLGRKPRFRWVSATAGRYDILVIARFRSNDDLFDFMQKGMSKANGIKNTETFICLHVQKSLHVRRA